MPSIRARSFIICVIFLLCILFPVYSFVFRSFFFCLICFPYLHYLAFCPSSLHPFFVPSLLGLYITPIFRTCYLQRPAVLFRTDFNLRILSCTCLVLALCINFVCQWVFVPTTCSCYVTVNPAPFPYLVHPTRVSYGWTSRKHVNCDWSVVKTVVHYQTKDEGVVWN